MILSISLGLTLSRNRSLLTTKCLSSAPPSQIIIVVRACPLDLFRDPRLVGKYLLILQIGQKLTRAFYWRTLSKNMVIFIYCSFLKMVSLVTTALILSNK